MPLPCLSPAFRLLSAAIFGVCLLGGLNGLVAAPVTADAIFTDQATVSGNTVTTGTSSGGGTCGPAVSGDPYDTSVEQDAPAVYLRLVDASTPDGATAADASGCGRNGTWHGAAVYGAGRPSPVGGDPVPSFGSDGTVTLPSGVTPTGAFTAEVWAAPGQIQQITATTNLGLSGAWAVGYDGTGHALATVRTTDGVTHTIGGAGAPWISNATGYWHAEAIAYDPVAGTVAFYIDGALVGTLTGIGALAPAASGAVITAFEHANGSLASAAVYPAALSAAQVSAHYAAR